MRFVSAALLGLFLSSGTANAEEYVLAISPGGPYAATPGGEIARINKQRPLPNAFGSADIFGRKVESGSIQFIYFGRADNGQAMIRRLDIEVFSTATTMSRTPGFVHGQAWSSGQVWGTFSNGTGNVSGSSTSNVQVFGMTPTGETNTVLPPRASDFLADTTSAIPLPTRHVIQIHSIEPQRIVFSIKAPQPTPTRQTGPRKGDSSGKKPGWVPW